MTTQTQESTWNSYSAVWALPDPKARREALAAVLAQDCRYTDPIAGPLDCEGLQAYMVDFQERFPGARFRVKSFQAHNSSSLAQWDMVAADGQTLSTGTSFGRYNSAGRLTEMRGFFEVQR